MSDTFTVPHLCFDYDGKAFSIPLTQDHEFHPCYPLDFNAVLEPLRQLAWSDTYLSKDELENYFKIVKNMKALYDKISIELLAKGNIPGYYKVIDIWKRFRLKRIKYHYPWENLKNKNRYGIESPEVAEKLFFILFEDLDHFSFLDYRSRIMKIISAPKCFAQLGLTRDQKIKLIENFGAVIDEIKICLLEGKATHGACVGQNEIYKGWMESVFRASCKLNKPEIIKPKSESEYDEKIKKGNVTQGHYLNQPLIYRRGKLNDLFNPSDPVFWIMEECDKFVKNHKVPIDDAPSDFKVFSPQEYDMFFIYYNDNFKGNLFPSAAEGDVILTLRKITIDNKAEIDIGSALSQRYKQLIPIFSDCSPFDDRWNYKITLPKVN